MVLRRLFGPSDHPAPATDASSAPAASAAPVPAASAGAPAAASSSSDPAAETATVRKIVAQLEALPIEQRKFVAGFAYILGRAANADMDISPQEVALMEQTVSEVGGLPEAQAVLVVQMARSQAELYGGTEDYLVTREFAKIATEEQRFQLLRCCFAVEAADDSISASESTELNEIARELGFTEDQLRTVRDEYKEKLSAIQQMRRMAAAGNGGSGTAAAAEVGAAPGAAGGPADSPPGDDAGSAA